MPTAKWASALQAAIDGATEVMPSVAASVATTIIAFAPMFFVSGVMGKFMAVIPFAVIAMLLISLAESTFVLPCHFAHPHTGFFRCILVLAYPLRPAASCSSGSTAGRRREWTMLTSVFMGRCCDLASEIR